VNPFIAIAIVAISAAVAAITTLIVLIVKGIYPDWIDPNRRDQPRFHEHNIKGAYFVHDVNADPDVLPPSAAIIPAHRTKPDRPAQPRSAP
jgi:hypothetical protein